MGGLLRFLTAVALTILSLSAYAVTISGRVVDLGRKRSGIPAVEITLQTFGENPTEVTTYTDAAGRFKLTGLPRAARAKLTAARRGWLNYPTTAFISTQETSSDAFMIKMIAEGRDAEYYREFAAEIAETEPSERPELRTLWFSLPVADAAIVKQEFAALNGDPEHEYALYIAEREKNKDGQNDSAQYAQTWPTNGSTTTWTGTSTTSTTNSSTMTSTTHETTTRTRLRKD